jgi:hypothetical protein
LSGSALSAAWKLSIARCSLRCATLGRDLGVGVRDRHRRRHAGSHARQAASASVAARTTRESIGTSGMAGAGQREGRTTILPRPWPGLHLPLGFRESARPIVARTCGTIAPASASLSRAGAGLGARLQHERDDALASGQPRGDPSASVVTTDAASGLVFT